MALKVLRKLLQAIATTPTVSAYKYLLDARIAKEFSKVIEIVVPFAKDDVFFVSLN